MATREATLPNGTKLYRHSTGYPFIRYFSLYRQTWETADFREEIPDREYAAMSAEERDAVLAFLPKRPLYGANRW